MSAIQTIRSTVNGLDELASIIANPDAGGPVRQAIGNSGRAVCNAYGNVQLAAPLLVGPAKTAIDLVCKPYFDGAGFDSPQGVAPFSGGQCEGISYRATGTIQDTATSCSTGNPSTTSPTAVNIVVGPGPISNLRKVTVVAGCRGLDAFQQILVTNGSGNDIVIGSFGSAAQTIFGYGEPTFSLSFVPSDGSSDQCGDPPAELTPGSNPPPSATGFPPGEEPGVDPTGQPFFFVPDIDVPGQEPLPLPDNPLGGSPGSTPQPSGDNSPGEPDAVGNAVGDAIPEDSSEDVDFGEPPEGKIWVGCVVEFTVDNAYGGIPNTGPENTVYPLTVGNASLRYGNIRGTSIQVRSRWTELFRPNTALEVTGAFVQTRLKTTAIVRPVSVTVCKEPQCLGE